MSAKPPNAVANPGWCCGVHEGMLAPGRRGTPDCPVGSRSQCMHMPCPTSSSALSDCSGVPVPHAQVCPRCVLRVFGHKVYGDYGLPQPPLEQLLQALQPAAGAEPGPVATAAGDGTGAPACGEGQAPCAADGLGAGPSAVAAAAEEVKATPDTYSACVLCMGALQLLDDLPAGDSNAAAVRAEAGASEAPAATPPPLGAAAQASAEPGATAAGTQGPPAPWDAPCAEEEQVAWQRVRRLAFNQAPLLMSEAAAGSAPVACLGPGHLMPALRHLLGEPEVPPPAAPAAAAEAPPSSPAPAAANGRCSGSSSGRELPFRTLAVEVGCLPPACALREAAIHVHVVARYGGRGLFPNWKPSEIVPLADVVR